MKKRFAFLEHAIDRSIPFILIILLAIIIIDIFFVTISETYHLQIEIIDGVIITIFFIDLVFKYRRARTIPQFFRRNWLNILAIFPFFLVFRVFDGAFNIFETFRGTFIEGQKIAHIGAELKELQVGETVQKLGKEITLAEEGGKLTQLTRSERLTRFLKPLIRGVRFGKAIEFYEKPKHHTQ